MQQQPVYSKKLKSHAVNPDLIFSGEMWILDSKKVWRKKVCRFDGRHLVWVKPHKFFDSLTSNLEKEFENQRMSTFTTGRYFDTDTTVVPALDSPMLSLPKDGFKLLTGQPGEWIECKRRYPNFELLQITEIECVCVLTRSKALAPEERMMMDKMFVLQRANGKHVFCRFKTDHEFMAWLFSIMNSLRFLKPEGEMMREIETSTAKDEEIMEALAQLTQNSVTFQRDLDSVTNKRDFGQNEFFNNMIVQDVIPGADAETEEKPTVTMLPEGDDSTVIVHEQDSDYGFESERPNLETPILSPTATHLSPEMKRAEIPRRKMSHDIVRNQEAPVFRNRSTSLSNKSRAIPAAQAADVSTVDEVPEFITNENELPNHNQLARAHLLKGHKNAAHTPTVIRVDSVLYRQLSRHGILGNSPKIEQRVNSRDVSVIVDPEMAELYRQLISKLDEAGFD